MRPSSGAWRSAAPARIFVMGGGSGRRTAAGRLDHGGAWRDEQAWPLARAELQRWYLHGGGALQRAKAAPGAAPSQYDFDPRFPVPSISANVSSLREYAPPDPSLKDGVWPPTMRSRELIQPGGADQREADAAAELGGDRGRRAEQFGAAGGQCAAFAFADHENAGHDGSSCR